MKFIEQSHTYISPEGEQYLGVTSLIKQYEPKKDWDEIARAYAKKHKKTQEEVQAGWKEEGRKSIEKGVSYHAKMESEFVVKGEVDIDGKIYKVVPSPMEEGIKMAIPLSLEEGVYPEIIIYSNKYKVSGQADLVEIANGKINIKDYKTSKEIKKESYKHWRKGHEMMLFPLGHLMNCNYNQYALQLNIYMSMLKAHNRNLKQGDMLIYHVKDNETIIYKVPNLQKEAKILLEHHYEQLKYSF